MNKIDSNTPFGRARTKPAVALASLMLFAGLVPCAKADETNSLAYHVDIDTSALAGRPYSLYFSFADNSLASFTFNNFVFQNGAASGDPVNNPYQDFFASGSIQNDGFISFYPTSFSSQAFGMTAQTGYFTQDFTKTTTGIHFDVNFTLRTNANTIPTQNIFSIGLIDNNTSILLGTNAPDKVSLINQYVGSFSTPDDLYAYKSTNPDGVTSSVYANDAYTSGSSPVTVNVTAVPEPSAYAMIGAGALGMAALIGRRKGVAKISA